MYPSSITRTRPKSQTEANVVVLVDLKGGKWKEISSDERSRNRARSEKRFHRRRRHKQLRTRSEMVVGSHVRLGLCCAAACKMCGGASGFHNEEEDSHFTHVFM
ncbi:hypothetical protein P8452_33466 [Trifolium repens]|nr:hypothetical protein P8452_33466 [Trifolium repens]